MAFMPEHKVVLGGEQQTTTARAFKFFAEELKRERRKIPLLAAADSSLRRSRTARTARRGSGSRD